MLTLKAISSKVLHHASHKLSSMGEADFKAASFQIEQCQTAIFRALMDDIEGTQSADKHSLDKNSCIEDFQNLVPVTEYDDWSNFIARQQQGEPKVLSKLSCQRYQPTSGSTSKIKWIPYTSSFLDQLDHAIGPWMSDLYQQFPDIKQGKHYWSLSWVPGDLRDKLTTSINDDLQLLPWWKRLFMARTMAVPESLSLAKSSEDSFFATACYLASCRDLSFISVWSPTFALSLLELIQSHKDLIIDVLENGKWPLCFSELHAIKAPKNTQTSLILKAWDGEINAEFTKNLWPQLGLISAWDTSSSTLWAQKLKDLFRHSKFQGKGLWATEGVISIPYKQQYPLAITSHFYEFEDLDTQQIHTSWQLQKGQHVRPIISTGSGLLRYALKDQLKVTGFMNQCPCLEFIGRLDGIDMVGEKLSPEIAVEIIDDFNHYSQLTPISLLALPTSKLGSKPFYALLCKGVMTLCAAETRQLETKLNQLLEAKLSQCFHYHLARELGQLNRAEVLIMPNAMEIYTDHKISQGMVAGNIKIEPLTLWQQHDLLKSNFYAEEGEVPEIPTSKAPNDANEEISA
ncbi:MAG: hypothetical protein ACI8O8_001761 [Oleiphilaceae bacterium]|jgi:hypothetical protein